MANITINEYSATYAYNVGNNSFATVALPITASWGPGYIQNSSETDCPVSDVIWRKYASNQEGMEQFVRDYRGPFTNYRAIKDYSYQIALTLLASGYDVLVCRVCPDGTNAADNSNSLIGAAVGISAKYPGSFGNDLQFTVTSKKYKEVNNAPIYYHNLIVYVVNESGGRSAVENLTFFLDPANEDDRIAFIGNIESNFLSFDSTDLAWGNGYDAVDRSTTSAISLQGGADFTAATLSDPLAVKYAIGQAAIAAYELLKDKLSYDFQRVISPGWDAYGEVVQTKTTDEETGTETISYSDPTQNNSTVPNVYKIHAELMDVGANCRCGTALIDIPKSITRCQVWDDDADNEGYAQKLSHYSVNDFDGLYKTHSALFAPWGQYQYIGEARQLQATPSFLALLIERNLLKQQTLQYEWLLPSSRRHTLNMGKLDYTVTAKQLNDWVTTEGVSLNVITTIPGVGPTIWGNSTIYDVPPASYQALANKSTRYLVNAVENVAYQCGIAITFQYNNAEAYSKFYAGVVPILDTMRNCGAIDDYRVQMSADVDALDQVRANSVVGKIYLVINGVINDVTVDLICLPQGTDLSGYTL